MLQIMEISASGYNATAMKREHFPVHMLADENLLVKYLVLVYSCFQRGSTQNWLQERNVFVLANEATITDVRV